MFARHYRVRALYDAVSPATRQPRHVCVATESQYGSVTYANEHRVMQMSSVEIRGSSGSLTTEGRPVN